VLGPAALIGAGLFVLRAGGAREASLSSAESPESGAGLVEPGPAEAQALEELPRVAPEGPAAGRSVGEAHPEEDSGPRSPETALVFHVVDGRSGAALEEFEVRAGRSFLRPLLGAEGRIRHAFPGGEVRFPGLIEGRAGEDLQLAIVARGYEELRLPGLYVAPGRELDLGTLRLSRAPRLTVLVLDDLTGAPVAGARVTLLAANALAAPEGHPPLPGPLDPWSARTDRDGRVLLTSRPGEAARLSVRHGEHAPFDLALSLPLAEEHVESVRLRPRSN